MACSFKDLNCPLDSNCNRLDIFVVILDYYFYGSDYGRKKYCYTDFITS